MVTFYDIRKLIPLEHELEVLDSDGYLIQEGINGETMWEDAVLDSQVYMIIPGIVTKVILERN